MGYLIRHIHNRDLAIENLVRAYVRRSFVLSAPSHVLQELRRAAEMGGVQLPAGTLLTQPGGATGRRARSAPGEYAVDVPIEARGNRTFDLRVPTGEDDRIDDPASAFLRGKIMGICREMSLGSPNLEQVTMLSSAIHLNGRPYREDDYFEYVKTVPRTQWSRTQDIQYVGVGRVSQMCLVETTRGEDECVFISFHPVRVLSKEGNLLLLQRPDRVQPDNVMDCIHVDRVVFKLRVVQDPDNPATSFGIRMWEAR